MATDIQVMFLLLLCVCADADPTDRLRKLSTRELFALAREYDIEDKIRRGGMLEKGDIVSELANVIMQTEQRLASKARFNLLKRVGIGAAVVATLIFLREPLAGFLGSATRNVRFQLNERQHLARYASNIGSPAAAVAITICGLLDVLALWVQLSVVGSWVLPPRSRLARRFLYSGIGGPSFPVSLGQILSSGRPGSSSAAGGWSIDVAPMFILWLLRFAKRRLEGFVLSRIQQARKYS